MKGTITEVRGVYASGHYCGIKAHQNALTAGAAPGKKSSKSSHGSETKNDLAFIYIPDAVASAAVFTRNLCAAPCVDYGRNCFRRGLVKAVVINSGNANAATGKTGVENNLRISELAAELLGLKPREVAVASTGIIGKQLPMQAIVPGLAGLLHDPLARDGNAAADGILTTDLTRKNVVVRKRIGSELVTVAGMAKGSGMIAPNMATMLGFIVTDFHCSRAELQLCLRAAVDDTFNMISVDTDTSTNDMVLAFSTGAKAVKGTRSKLLTEFTQLLREASEVLAKKIVIDGEGANVIIEAHVSGAASQKDARVIAKSIIDSPLIKTAIHGADPNWGRVVMAAGKAPGVKVKLDTMALRIQGVSLLKNGLPLPFERDRVSMLLKTSPVVIDLSLGQGKHEARAWGCDLSTRYVEINTAYN